MTSVSGIPHSHARATSSDTKRISSASVISVSSLLGAAFEQVGGQLAFFLDQGVDRSSIVPRQTNLWTSTLRCWPMRNARSVAWFSTAGFHQRSKWITCEAAVRFSPVPPALSERTKNGGPSSRWNWSTSALRRLTAVPPCSTRPGRPKTGAKKLGQRLGHLAELGEDQRLLLPRGDFLADLRQPGELAALVGREAAVAQQLAGMVAELLEPHQVGQHQAAPLHAVDALRARRPAPRPAWRTAPPAACSARRTPGPRSCRAGRR